MKYGSHIKIKLQQRLVVSRSSVSNLTFIYDTKSGDRILESDVWSQSISSTTGSNTRLKVKNLKLQFHEYLRIRPITLNNCSNIMHSATFLIRAINLHYFNVSKRYRNAVFDYNRREIAVKKFKN